LHGRENIFILGGEPMVMTTTQQTIGGANAFRKKQIAGYFLARSSRIVRSGGPETGSFD
jgi:hypothetical protein